MRLDYYELLNCERGATDAELKNGYRAMAKKFHPDVNAGDAEAEERFKLVVEAYRVLGDPEKRADYDTWLDRHAIYAEKPELENLRRRPARFSVSSARARRENRDSRRREEREERRRPRRFGERAAASVPLPKRGFLPLLNLPRVKLGTHPFLPIIYGLAVVCFIVPPIVHHYRLVNEVEERKAAAEAEQTAKKLRPRKATICARTAEELMALPAEMTDLERHVNYLSYTDNLIRAAHRGDAGAQVRYGMLLYTGQGAWFDPDRLTRDPQAAYAWWERAAALGDPNAKGLHTLKSEAPRLRLVELPPGPTDDYDGDLPL